MKYCFTFLFSLLMSLSMAQHQSFGLSERALSEVNLTSSPQKLSWFFGLTRDYQHTFRSRSPLLIALASSNTSKGQHYWMGSMTTQSYNQGKLGTYYLWDLQGNLAESRTFLDIAGKNKRGLKLVFRRR